MPKSKNLILTLLFLILILEVVIVAPKKLGTKTAESESALLQRDAALKGKGPGADGNPQTSDQTMKGVHLVEASGGQKEWELNSDMAQGFKDGIWKLQGVHANLFGNGDTSYKVSGERGIVSTLTKDMQITGNVVTESSEGYTFRSPSIKYNSGQKELTTPGAVHVVGPRKNGERFEFQGTDFKADLTTNVLRINENVHAVKSLLDDQKVMNITSDWCRVHGKNNEAHFERNVQVDLGTVRMTGEQADFIYDQQTKNLKSLLMQGEVKVTDHQRWATAEKVRVLFAENEFVLLGNPRVVQNENELRGEEIHFMDGGKTVRVIRAKARVDADEAERSQ